MIAGDIMTVDELKKLATTWLLIRYPGAKIVYEMPCRDGGLALIDVAAICDDQIIGVEIKGEKDRPARLKIQGPAYSAVCRQVFLLASPKISKNIQKNRPRNWLPLCVDGGEEYGLTFKNSPLKEPLSASENKGNYHGKMKRGVGMGLMPAALASLVWTSEYNTFSNALNRARDKDPWMKGVHLDFGGRYKHDKIQSIAERVPLKLIETAVCEVLKTRPNWKED